MVVFTNRILSGLAQWRDALPGAINIIGLMGTLSLATRFFALAAGQNGLAGLVVFREQMAIIWWWHQGTGGFSREKWENDELFFSIFLGVGTRYFRQSMTKPYVI